jgi:radical SAM superfamily enzyme YgiQ (UPF0313 family)
MIFLTHGYFLSEDEKEREIMRPYVPLGILYISAYLDKHQVENRVFDSTFSDLAALKSALLKEKPSLIGIYTNLMTRLNVLKIISFIKTEPSLSDSKIILGGPEIRHHAENLLKYGADCLVVGEGEETMLELCMSYKTNGVLPKTIHGIAYLDGECVVLTPERNLIKDINTLPFPNRHKADLTLYASAWKQKHGYSMFSVSTMRGCPYTCKWCSRAVYGGTYRRRKAALVAEEMLQLKTIYSPDRIWFVDDVFTISHKWLAEFVAEIKKQNAFIPYEIITRADRMNEDVVKLLKESGCFRVWIGAESGSQKIIDAMDRRVEVQQVGDMIKLCKRYGIEAGTFIMLGYPGETKKDIKETILHLKTSDPDQYTITITYPIKGTPLYEEIKDRIISKNNWTTSTDRQIDFKRNYSKRFYELAVKWVYNEVNFSREKRPIAKLKFKLKSLAAQAIMSLV